MRLYIGFRTIEGTRVVTTEDGDTLADLPMRRDLWDHSPTGFEWGYHGSGPAQLALALAAFATGDGGRAVRVHQELKRQMVCRLAKDHWVVRHTALLKAIEAIEKEGRGLVEGRE